ncbi:MAG: HPr(Ser) kinase/phosphatase [Kiritimatiellaeota bacterium]|nr:HPr(Ser) kinase/phosphatase [Kiritimatiellota bacterium]
MPEHPPPPPPAPGVTPKVTVGDFVRAAHDKLGLEVAGGRDGLDRVIEEPVLHRPGLPLAGFYKHFPFRRIQLIGQSEYEYLQSLDDGLRAERIAAFCGFDMPCVVITWGNPPFPELLALAGQRRIPVLSTVFDALHFTNTATLLLEELSAPVAGVHATFLLVAGLGVLIEGKAGLGKSETALGLIKRGHALVADDLTRLRRDTDGRLIGRAAPSTREYMEIRGLGIIHVPSIFGIASVTDAAEVNFLITLVSQDDGGDDLVDRAGDNIAFREFLGVRVPQIIISVAPGRDIVNIVETAAMEYKLRASGHTAHKELDARLKSRNTGQP